MAGTQRPRRSRKRRGPTSSSSWALAALTVITVAISYLDLRFGASVVLALIIAFIKGSLVAGFFMHLISEEKLIYSVLVLTLAFFLALMFLPLGHYLDRVGG